MRIRSTYTSIVLAAAAAFGLALAGAAGAEEESSGSSSDPSSTMDDMSRDTMPGSSPLADKVQEELQKHEGLQDVRVQAKGESEVTLEGAVASAMERDEATRVAESVSGVEKVENNLQIGSGASDVSSPPPAQ